jgi:lysophospholipase L1-like esterase
MITTSFSNTARIVISSIICLFVSIAGYSQTTLFQNGERVCFVGNSITHAGEFHHNIFLYYVTRFPFQPVTFFNCGISGDVTDGILNRMEDDILIHKPAYSAIMIGMNDVRRNLYGATPTQNADTLRQREEALIRYRNNLDSIVRIFLSGGIKVILQKPTIYDQTAILKTPDNLGVNDALKKCADFGEALAQKYNLVVIDYWSILNRINIELQKKDPSATIIGPDRVHPAANGNLIIAYQFLKTSHSPDYVAQINLKSSTVKSNKASKNCKVKYISKKADFVSFEVTENALPFPTVDNQKQGLELVPFTQELNVEELRTENLKPGFYQLVIDTTVIETFTEKQLNSGINLSLFSNTPQYKQAMLVRNVLAEMWKAEADLRTIKYVEIKHLRTFENKQDLVAVKTYLDDLFVNKLSYNIYYKTQFDRYILIKPNEKKIELEIEVLRKRAYDLAQPSKHVFKLIFMA